VPASRWGHVDASGILLRTRETFHRWTEQVRAQLTLPPHVSSIIGASVVSAASPKLPEGVEPPPPPLPEKQPSLPPTDDSWFIKPWNYDPSSDTPYPIWFLDPEGPAYQTVLGVASEAASVLQALHETTGLPWWGTIVVGTAAVRLAFLPLQLYGLRNASNAFDARQDMARLVTAHRQAIEKLGPAATVMERLNATRVMLRGMQAALHKAGCYPWRTFTIPLAQIPAVMAGIMGARHLVLLGDESFETGGALWFTDLTTSDVTYALPAVCVGLTYGFLEYAFRRPKDGAAVVGGASLVSGGMMQKFKSFLQLWTVLSIPLTAHLPAGLYVSWMTGTLWGLAYVSAIRTDAVHMLVTGRPTTRQQPAKDDVFSLPGVNEIELKPIKTEEQSWGKRDSSAMPVIHRGSHGVDTQIKGGGALDDRTVRSFSTSRSLSSSPPGGGDSSGSGGGRDSGSWRVLDMLRGPSGRSRTHPRSRTPEEEQEETFRNLVRARGRVSPQWLARHAGLELSSVPSNLTPPSLSVKSIRAALAPRTVSDKASLGAPRLGRGDEEAVLREAIKVLPMLDVAPPSSELDDEQCLQWLQGVFRPIWGHQVLKAASHRTSDFVQWMQSGRTIDRDGLPTLEFPTTGRRRRRISEATDSSVGDGVLPYGRSDRSAELHALLEKRTQQPAGKASQRSGFPAHHHLPREAVSLLAEHRQDHQRRSSRYEGPIQPAWPPRQPPKNIGHSDYEAELRDVGPLANHGALYHPGLSHGHRELFAAHQRASSKTTASQWNATLMRTSLEALHKAQKAVLDSRPPPPPAPKAAAHLSPAARRAIDRFMARHRPKSSSVPVPPPSSSSGAASSPPTSGNSDDNNNNNSGSGSGGFWKWMSRLLGGEEPSKPETPSSDPSPATSSPQEAKDDTPPAPQPASEGPRMGVSTVMTAASMIPSTPSGRIVVVELDEDDHSDHDDDGDTGDAHIPEVLTRADIDQERWRGGTANSAARRVRKKRIVPLTDAQEAPDDHSAEWLNRGWRDSQGPSLDSPRLWRSSSENSADEMSDEEDGYETAEDDVPRRRFSDLDGAESDFDSAKLRATNHDRRSSPKDEIPLSRTLRSIVEEELIRDAERRANEGEGVSQPKPSMAMALNLATGMGVRATAVPSNVQRALETTHNGFTDLPEPGEDLLHDIRSEIESISPKPQQQQPPTRDRSMSPRRGGERR
jgi:YidC/Oxa1 family membrane protein insertase